MDFLLFCFENKVFVVYALTFFLSKGKWEIPYISHSIVIAKTNKKALGSPERRHGNVCLQ